MNVKTREELTVLFCSCRRTSSENYWRSTKFLEAVCESRRRLESNIKVSLLNVKSSWFDQFTARNETIWFAKVVLNRTHFNLNSAGSHRDFLFLARAWMNVNYEALFLKFTLREQACTSAFEESPAERQINRRAIGKHSKGTGTV